MADPKGSQIQLCPISEEEAVRLGVTESMLGLIRGKHTAALDGPVSGIFHVFVSAEVVATFTANDRTLVFGGFRKINDGMALGAL